MMHILEDSVAQKYSQTALDHCDELAQVSELEEGILRQYLTSKHKAGNQLVEKWMQQEGLKTWQDQAGNQWGRLPCKDPDAPSLILGSHLDTVPNAGAYDGILGVMLGLELMKIAKANQLALPFHLDLVGFVDEEGTRFATTLIGSSAIAGSFNSQWLEVKDRDGVTMADAMQQFGLEPSEVINATLDPEKVLAYWEVHIEQGPVLEAKDLQVGVVTAIAGAKRAVISYTGITGHAGTSPMNLRKDSLAAIAELTLAIETIALNCTHQEVATVGKISAKPGATNVIAGYSEMTLDARAQNDQDLEVLLNKIVDKAKLIAEKRELLLTWKWTHQAEAVQCDQNIQDLLATACEENNLPVFHLASGAGHDGMAVAKICPIGMLFIRSPGGVSHHPSESVMKDDVTQALKVMYSALSSYAV
ncbi:allantoate amidohydrolase [Paraglaciecola aquimarina]|uniref:Allantoate amidohydrolase n=1 Tax=Paraglaciecola aquimarina TaxID=1235557 RepID=A0ABU3SYG7_9ALTE|nr:allantoate amidohydrolase [Paraglaciecola aquimarina]MDU0355060.1 allantoate amidohydrolase [Paraglaciecola aquimarina]